jgi:hypothetical protein
VTTGIEGTCFYFAYDTKEKEYQNSLQADLLSWAGGDIASYSQIALCFDALPSTESICCPC